MSTNNVSTTSALTLGEIDQDNQRILRAVTRKSGKVRSLTTLSSGTLSPLPPTLYTTRAAKTGSSSKPSRPSSKGGWDSGVSVSLGYRLKSGEDHPVPVVLLNDVDVSALGIVALRVDPTSGNLQAVINYDPSITPLLAKGTDRWPASAKIEFSWDGSGFAGYLKKYDSKAHQEGSDEFYWEGQAADTLPRGWLFLGAYVFVFFEKAFCGILITDKQNRVLVKETGDRTPVPGDTFYVYSDSPRGFDASGHQLILQAGVNFRFLTPDDQGALCASQPSGTSVLRFQSGQGTDSKVRYLRLSGAHLEHIADQSLLVTGGFSVYTANPVQ